MNSKLSVVMSVCNAEKHLAVSVDSVLAQTFADFEFLIVNDASTDGTANILRDYAARDPRITIMTNSENKGLTKSLNLAIAHSRGEYIARMDADDRALPERFSKQVAFLDGHPAYGLVGCWATVIDDTGAPIDTYAWESEDMDIRKNLIKYNCIIHPSVVLRRSVFDASGGYDETFRYAQDYDLFFRIAQHAKVYNLPERLLCYRVSASSITGSKNFSQAWCAMRARWHAIRSGMYSPLYVVFLLRPLVGMLLPLWLKRAIKKSAL